MLPKKVSVGLLLLTQLEPHGPLVALLQRRGKFNFETMKTETWPGLCQITVRGGVNSGESITKALFREIEEELGPAMRSYVERYFSQAVELGRHETEEFQLHSFVLKVPHFPLSMIELHRGAEKILPVSERDLKTIETAEEKHKKEGVPNHCVMMFADEKKSLEKAFKFFAQ